MKTKGLNQPLAMSKPLPKGCFTRKSFTQDDPSW